MLYKHGLNKIQKLLVQYSPFLLTLIANDYDRSRYYQSLNGTWKFAHTDKYADKIPLAYSTIKSLLSFHETGAASY
jgi:hypothetical protein